jgi:hypothetical protein
MIGLKLNSSIPIDSIDKKIREALSELDFEVAPQQNMQGPPIIIKPPVEILGIKDNVELRINRDAHSINIEGENPTFVKKIFDEMPEIFERIKFELDETIIFYEIITNIIIETEKSPRQVINSSCNINLNSLSDLDTYVSGIKINSVDEGSKKLIGMVIEPRVGNPNNFYFVNLIFRSPDMSGLTQFHQELPEKIFEVINSLEE